jgi:enamine deaminase RidA (YjgF/YER057c/UK114 family)
LFDVTPAASSADSAAQSVQKNPPSIPMSTGDSRPIGRAHEMTVTIRPASGENFEEMFTRAAGTLEGATVLSMLAFGAVGAAIAANEAMQQVFGKLDWPVTWIEGASCEGDGIAGVQISALTGGLVQRLERDGSVVGSVFEEGGVRHCVLGGLGPRKGCLSRGDQTRQTLEQMEAALREASFSLADVVRTWFYLDDILAWYDEFNAARTNVYRGVKFRTGSMPASTGIGARNPLGTALATAARATQCLSPRARVEEIVSPLQCPAPAYGSSFSRAMEITTTGARHLLISGTASIAPGGETLWETDVHKQVDQTMKVVEAILHSRGFSFNDLTRAVAYFKHDADVAAFATWCRRNRLPSLPVVPVQGEICRDNLLFELEADARKSI